MTALQDLLQSFRDSAQNERDKGTLFEHLAVAYLRHERFYADYYEQVWTYADWAATQDLKKRDSGIDLVAQVRGTGEFHAIQCKFFAPDYRVQKADIDSFFTASGKKTFAHRLIITTTDHWSENAEDALRDQQPPAQKLTLHDLEDSQIDWAQFSASRDQVVLKPKKTLREHQQRALEAVTRGLTPADRGKLIMACGTGKTFTSLKIAEALTGAGKRVLFLVPSLSLLSQTLTEWTQESTIPLHSFAVCSDSDVGKKRSKEDDAITAAIYELRYPATTEAKRLADALHQRHDGTHMTVVFSTYHSLAVVHKAQAEYGIPAFDLVICDEAHRTTGASFAGDDDSAFVRIHDAEYIQARKRLYMTATPRIYSDMAEARAEQENTTLYGMNNTAVFGEELFVITFSEAVKRKLLVDYKVIVLAVEESHINRRLQNLLRDPDNQLKMDDAAKIVGCWKALAKQGLTEQDAQPMHRAVAFCQVIEPSFGKKNPKVSSKQIASMFQAVVEEYQQQEALANPESAGSIASTLTCQAEHVDGGMNAGEKEARLDWLKADTPANTCRILSNVRCLSEGVDVPALDAVLFLTPRNSQVDVVQSVGRVMRNAPGKERGYIILPVVIPAGVEPHEALNDNKTYKVVWEVLQALRSHDDRFDAMVNKLDLIGKDPSKMEVIAVTDKFQKPAKKTSAARKAANRARGGGTIGQRDDSPEVEQVEMPFEIGEIERAIYAKLVQKVGNRHHWEDWANDIAKIARTHIDRIHAILENPANTTERETFAAFAKELRDDLNDSIRDDEIIEMLAQHLITKPVFDALFEGYSFASHNPMSQAMQAVLEQLQEHRLDKEADTLQAFYESVKERAKGIDNAAGKQKIVVELYDKFFRNAFPRMTERLGIVYTPVEVVDFILHSVAHLLETEFGQTLGSEGVHILDPFTGTGTFITRLLQSGLINPAQLPYKYQHEIHANEMVLLAYYIAAINIEAAYHGIMGGEYQPFEGICLTDTFQLYEKEDLVDNMAALEENDARRRRQKRLDIRVIVGNPPYSAGQTSANDNNANISYPHLDERIQETYAKRSVMTSVRQLYDSYIRAIRWASDRIGNNGIIGFVTNAGWIEANLADGLRKALVEEFSSLYVFHLRGNQRTSGEQSRKEGGKIFGSGSRAPIAISLLVKNPNAAAPGQIYFHDIGDYLSREDKLETIARFGSVAGITEADAWNHIIPDAHGDWLKQRDNSFMEFIAMGDKKGDGTKLFENFSLGVATGRDTWCYNASRRAVTDNMTRMIAFYNQETASFQKVYGGLDKKARDDAVDGFIDTDPTKISWTHNLKEELAKGCHFAFEQASLTSSLYRPFTKQWLYFNRRFNERVYQMPRIFPEAGVENVVICVSGVAARNFSCLITNALPCLDNIEKGQCFPLYLYDTEAPVAEDDIFAHNDASIEKYNRREAITDAGLSHFREAYPNEVISKEDVFYYVYGLLHSPDYRERYADNLSKELPRIPRVKTAADFWAFSQAGRDLAALHLHYETVEPYPLTIEQRGKPLAGSNPLTDADYRVEKMKYGKNGKEKDLSTVHYNDKITLTGIPLEAYGYVVNGKPALDWVIERQCVKTDKASRIVNDANAWATETMHDYMYSIGLFCRVVTVSLETMKIVRGLPGLSIGEG
ncbi:DEAD/DEAH box helicase [Acidithiobacillus sp. M4-SHS-6]|uniref:DEAD/DEAH box helicase n=1 Tax=Acidithiobacillus sp. M4-SHS-6 TaxID=3383024 RepID=UPI0039BDB47B